MNRRTAFLILLSLSINAVALGAADVKDVTPSQLQTLSEGRPLDVVLKNGQSFRAVVVGSSPTAVDLRILRSESEKFAPESTHHIAVQDFGAASMAVRHGNKGRVFTAIVAAIGAGALAAAVIHYDKSPAQLDCSPQNSPFPGRSCGGENQRRADEQRKRKNTAMTVAGVATAASGVTAWRGVKMDVTKTRFRLIGE